MSTIQRGLKALAFVAALSLALAAQATTQIKVDLGPPIINGNQVEMDVTLNYLDDASDTTGITFIQLDVSASSASLGTDYADRFDFLPSTKLGNLPWELFADFGNGVGFGNVSYILPLPANFADSLNEAGNPHLLGKLVVDMTGLGVGTVHTVDVGFFDPSGTTAFYLDFNNPDAGEFQVDQFDDDSINAQTFTVPRIVGADVPEPASISLALMGLAGLALRRRTA